MENKSFDLIDFIRGFKHVEFADVKIDNVTNSATGVSVTLRSGYIFADIKSSTKIFENVEAALIGANIIHVTKENSRSLVNGKIPAFTTCFFRDKCNSAKNNDCGHLGVGHTVEYSCGYARLFDIYNYIAEI